MIVNMNNANLIFEREDDVSSLSNFYCGYEPIDSFIHNKEKGLEKYVVSGLTALWIVRNNESPVAIFALSKSSLILNSFDNQELERGGVKIDPDIFDSKDNYPAVEIDYLAVAKEWRGKGLGEHIIAKIYEQICKDKFSATMFITVEAIDTPGYSAVGFYKKCGFKESDHAINKRLSQLNFTGTQSLTKRMYLHLSPKFLE